MPGEWHTVHVWYQLSKCTICADQSTILTRSKEERVAVGAHGLWHKLEHLRRAHVAFLTEGGSVIPIVVVAHEHGGCGVCDLQRTNVSCACVCVFVCVCVCVCVCLSCMLQSLCPKKELQIHGSTTSQVW